MKASRSCFLQLLQLTAKDTYLHTASMVCLYVCIVCLNNITQEFFYLHFEHKLNTLDKFNIVPDMNKVKKNLVQFECSKVTKYKPCH